MNVRFDVLVEAIPLIRCGEVDDTHARRRIQERLRLDVVVALAWPTAKDAIATLTLIEEKLARIQVAT